MFASAGVGPCAVMDELLFDGELSRLILISKCPPPVLQNYVDLYLS